MHRFRRAAALTLIAAVLFPGCDNVGRAFDPNVGPPPNPNPTGPVNIQVPPATGDVRDGVPLVRAVYPKATGWPTSVPVVVEFSESMNAASIAPTSAQANDGKVYVRAKGTTQALPATYDLLAGGRLLVLRPSGLTSTNNQAYEVVIKAGVRDTDGVQYQVQTEEILAEFTPNAPTTEVDGKILAVYPRDSQRDIVRETQVIAVFTRAATTSSVTAASFQLATDGGLAVPAAINFPVQTLGQADGRVAQITPSAPLAASTVHQLTVSNAITFGTNGVLQFGNRTPYSRFTATAVPAPTSVTVANAAANFADKINRNNLATLQLQIAVPADAAAGDKVVARIYGGDKSTSATNDIAYVERSLVLPTGFTSPVQVDFSGALGTLTSPKFDDGSVMFVTQLRRGTPHSGMVLGSTSARFDMTAPTITRFGPPGPDTGTDIYTDQEELSLYGTASEPIAEASLALVGNPNTAGLWAASNDGRFQLRPIALGPLNAPRQFNLTVTDLAGNLSASAVTGSVVQRGVWTGAVAGDLTVVVYDDVTLLPIASATVVVEPGTPVVPAVGQRTAATSTSGTAAFTGLVGATQTITVVAPGYSLTTLYGTAAAYAAIPLHPSGSPASTLRGNLIAQLSPGSTVVVGCSAFDDPTLLSVASTSSTPNAIPTTPIQANRPQVLTALAGRVEPTSVPAFNLVSCNLLGDTLTTFAPPGAPVVPAAEAARNLTLLTAQGVLVGSLATLLSEDFGLATGLDTANLVGGKPTVRLMLSLQGFAGQVPFGLGFATAGAGQNYVVNGTWSNVLSTQLAPWISGQWVTVDAHDTSGRVSRYRAALDLTTASAVDRMNPLAIPTVTGPAGPVTGAPAVTVADVIDVSGLTGALGLTEVVAQDQAGRQWRMLRADSDPAGGTDSYQFPDLSGAGVTGLLTGVGAWTIRAESRTFFPQLSSGGSVVLAEARRMEFGFARSASISVAVP